MTPRRVVITGAASGIGAATNEKFRDEGDNTYTVDIAPGCDVQVDLAQNKFHVPHVVDVLVCSHGVGGLGRTWDEVMDVNVKGVMHSVESVLPTMEPGGSIVFIASMTGVTVGNRGMKVANYAASKGAVVGYMRQLAVELAPRGIRVNAVCPGPVVTPMTDNLKKRDLKLYYEFFGGCLLEGYTMPKDIAGAVYYVAGARRITGTTLLIDGGYTAA